MLTARRKSRPGLSRQRSFPIHANPRTLSVDIGGTGIKVTGELPARVRVIANVAGLLGGIVLWGGEENTYGIR
jgi:hypothetical protein